MHTRTGLVSLGNVLNCQVTETFTLDNTGELTALPRPPS